MPNCGSQCWLCDMPIRFDTYKGCTHGCKYCFVQRNGKYDISKVQKGEGMKALMSWIQGKRTSEILHGVILLTLLAANLAALQGLV